MAAETGFDLDGTVYEVPSLDSLNMDEAQVLYDYSGLGIEDFVFDPDETEEQQEKRSRLFKNPGLMRALMHIAYQRKHPSQKPGEVKEFLSKLNIVTALSKLRGEDEAGPPDLTTEPNEQSKNGSVENTSRSGSDSSTGSEQEQAEVRTPITTGS